MLSPTQRQLTPDEVVAAARTAFGADTPVTGLAPLSGGSFGSVWRVDLGDGRRTVLKTAPLPDTPILTYERDMVGAEAAYLRHAAAAPDVPTARLLYAADEWMFMSMLPGDALPTLAPDVDTTVVRRECGAAIARLHTVTGRHFGYDGDRPSASTWPDAVVAIFDALLDDAARFGVTLPVSPAGIRAAVAAQRDVLAEVTEPSLLHFDLWDGNVLVEPGPDGHHLSGLVDGERYLWGDPLLDLVSPALMRDILDTPDDPFLTGYLATHPVALDAGARRRLRVYQAHLYLTMLVEYPSRGMTRDDPPGRWEAIEEVFLTAYRHLTG